MIISLIGMTGAGKTTVGKILADRLHYNFLDTDEIIRENTKKTPAEIFAESGEDAFRTIESETLENIFTDNKNNIILSCGGGIILRENNRAVLRQKSRIVWLIRPSEIILKNPDILNRPPINNDPENYHKIFKARESLYAQTCHVKINFADAEESAGKIIAQFI